MIAVKSNTKRKLLPRQIAEQYGVSVSKVIDWIKRGELKAFNAARTTRGRPRFLVDPDDLAAFEAARSVTPIVAPTPRRKKRLPNVTEFF